MLLSKAVRRASARATIGHREQEFSSILVETAQMLRPVVGIDERYEVALITGSGTAANETVIASIANRGPVLVVSNGEFGERLHAVAMVHNADVDHLQCGWRSPIDLDTVERALQERRYYLVLVVHHETSTGMLNPIAAISDLAHRHGAMIAVDAISSIGAEDVRAADWGIDVLVGASGKALSAMPGVGILVVRSSLLDTMTAPSGAGHYLDLYNHFHFMRTLRQTPNTPAVHVFVSLHASLCEITAQGVPAFQQVIRDRATYTRREVARMGLDFASYPCGTSSVITCVTLPEGLTWSRLARRFKRKGIVVYNGKGVLRDRVFQIGHIGALRAGDTPFAVRQLRKALRPARVSA